MKKILFLIVFLVSTAIGFSQTGDSVNVTFRVSLKGTGRKLNSDGLRVTGALGAKTQPDWSPTAALKMSSIASISDSVYAITIRVPRPANDTTQFKFINGGNWGDGTVATDNFTEDERGLKGLSCIYTGNGDGNRLLSTKGVANNGNIVLPVYKFNSCTVVTLAGTNDLTTVSKLNFTPNPVSDKAILSFDNIGNATHTLEIFSVTGTVLKTFAPSNAEQFTIETANLAKGIYFARLRNDKSEASTLKFVVE